jgi:hypothetical protein
MAASVSVRRIPPRPRYDAGMDLQTIHGYIVGFLIIGSWPVIGFWALALKFTRYEETPTFWRVVSVAQILLAVQLFLGMALLVLWTLGRAGLPGDGSAFQVTFHLLYGVVFPLVVLVVAHRGARAGRWNPHLAFAVVGLVNFGLTTRAWMVGSGFGS